MQAHLLLRLQPQPSGEFNSSIRVLSKYKFELTWRAAQSANSHILWQDQTDQTDQAAHPVYKIIKSQWTWCSTLAALSHLILRNLIMRPFSSTLSWLMPAKTGTLRQSRLLSKKFETRKTQSLIAYRLGNGETCRANSLKKRTKITTGISLSI